MPIEVYSKTIITDDGVIAVVDATAEVKSLKEKVASMYKDDALLTIEEVRQLLKLATKDAVQQKLKQGFFPPNTYVKKNGMATRFKKKALYKFLGLEY
ncbi:hypothetical protein [Deferribacter abyssi]|uniref:hypothetical protein n=1 Tax=Deferribacter abyssi TaxID=213806 RepID=UPI003C26B918